MASKGQQLIRTIFDTDNAFMQVCEKVLDLVTVNLLFWISCLPLVTIGIAKISLYQTLFQIRGGRRVKVTATYIRAFKSNWRLGLRLGLLELALVGISFFDLLLFWNQEALPFQTIKVVCLALLFFTTLLALCIYPLAARFELGFQEVLQTGLLLVSLNFPWFFLLLALLTGLLLALTSSGFVLLLGFSFFAFIGFAGLAFAQLPLLEKIFEKYSSV